MKKLAAFLIVETLCCAGMWLEGFNFDHRGRHVALAFGVSAFLGLWGASISDIWTND